MKYVSHGPMMVDVHMHKPQTNAKNFMDSLLAFWPGLQVLSSFLTDVVVLQRLNCLAVHVSLSQCSRLLAVATPLASNV